MLRIAKYLITGGIGMCVNIGLLFLLVDAAGLYYLLGSIMAVSTSTVVGFLLQKYWTFKASGKEGVAGQFGLYVAVAVMNIVLNTIIVYALVDYGGAHHILAQFTGIVVVAVSSYFIYKKIIFRSQAA